MDRTGTRVNLTLPDSLIAVLDRIGAVTGAGRATIIREWLIEGEPGFEQMATALEMAKNNRMDAFKLMADSMRQASQNAEQLELEIRKTRRAMMRKRT